MVKFKNLSLSINHWQPAAMTAMLKMMFTKVISVAIARTATMKAHGRPTRISIETSLYQEFTTPSLVMSVILATADLVG
jgi:hypothetical protein